MYSNVYRDNNADYYLFYQINTYRCSYPYSYSYSYYGFSGFSIDKFKEHAVIMKNKYAFAESHDNQNGY
jgi:hypothetical protein